MAVCSRCGNRPHPDDYLFRRRREIIVCPYFDPAAPRWLRWWTRAMANRKADR